MSDSYYFEDQLKYKQNRELSWLRFNERVLEEVDNLRNPLLERLKFAAIYSSNLDEFFMIRVGSLFDKTIYSANSIDNKSGLTPAGQLDLIYKMVETLGKKFNKYYKKLESILGEAGVSFLQFEDLNKEDRVFVERIFKDEIEPLLSPQIIGPMHPFPHLKNKMLYIGTLMGYKDDIVTGILPIPANLPTVLSLPGEAIRYIHTESVLLGLVNRLFLNYEILEKSVLCVTRNADISLEEDSDSVVPDYRKAMRKLLQYRKKLRIVRLETSKNLGSQFRDLLCGYLDIQSHQIFTISAPLRMDFVYSLIKSLPQTTANELLYKNWSPVVPQVLIENRMIQIASKHDLFFHYPYESMKPMLNFVKQAAFDPYVTSISITIYRLAMKTTLVDYLCAAAENGKDVTVIIELRARFDELNNIDWSEKLEDSGCRIIYGFKDYKVHSKLCLVTYEYKGKIKYITQIGTGNYNESTAEQYTDLSLITGNPEIGRDAELFFKNISIGKLEGEYNHLLVAPSGLKKTILKLIGEEISKGNEGRIFFNINSITDVDVIDKLAEASKSGVKVTMIVRGICCILPGIPGYTENIEITSIVGRFLEHARIYSFGNGDSQKLFISSADLMTRNLERRVEVACPIYDPSVRNEINRIIQFKLMDNIGARRMNQKGSLKRIKNQSSPFSSQGHFMLHSADMQTQKYKKFAKQKFTRKSRKYIEKLLIKLRW
jgi:polyphosphate kinase